MLIVGILIALLSALLAWVLFAPLTIKANTYRNEYFLQWGGVARAEILTFPDDIAFRLKVLFWKKDFYPLHPEPAEAPEKREKKKKTAGRSKTRKSIPFRRIWRALQSFRVKDFFLEADTNDYIWNALLIPVFYWIGPLRRKVHINFQGRNECRLHIENRLWRIAWAFLRG